MGVWYNVRSDLRLRNLTIYAQWTSVLATMLFYVSAFYGLFNYLNHLFALPSSLSLKWVLLNTFNVGVKTFLFPLAPLALELPQYIRPKPFLYLSTLSWFVLPLLNFISLLAYRFDSKNYVIMILSLPATFLLAVRIWTVTPGLQTRVGVNALYCGHLVFSIYLQRYAWDAEGSHWFIWCQYLIKYIATGMFGSAALLYGMAWIRRHTWVSSRLLGGTGIEPMVLMMPGRGPLYQSVGDETRVGAIRLE
ncbi:hypothetical protein P153DRAFT_124431 [Dothidotthia symphoricarpi CBS 119687]|uniref:Uncharacterized protein n=1 Tax=Dothidotthia symphoricarpi CBS 119687 TaxID=1392245 RepID=A0A6A6A0J9_9PLEO|nr:uncharacterized protein P153DRAFT_124431 [Dothidotthia symphoricarpi CBS 119687]KAF2124674.1 hypothetical protein P153DRAFT_124431 [Dothidotthia symphoricarpi CBS 119687]